MTGTVRIAILSDIHFAGAAEQARGNDYESRGLTNPLVRGLLRTYRRRVWMKQPLAQGRLLDDFLRQVGPVDYTIANGDYSCDSGFVGVSDDAACQSAAECLGKLRQRFGDRFLATIGDHELGKRTLTGHAGGMRLDSWRRVRDELKLAPFWRLELGQYLLLGVTSSLVALPVFESDALPEEWPQWNELRSQHLEEIRRAFAAVNPRQRLVLFCHDPTALPFLWREDVVRARLPQVDQTIIGHLHTPLVFWKSRLLAGMPRIGFLGHAVRRFTTALNGARRWQPFRVRLCPALAGIELRKDGGYLIAEIDPAAGLPARFKFHPLPR